MESANRTKEFSTRVESLYSEVEQWVQGLNIRLEKKSETIREEDARPYEVHIMVLRDSKGLIIAELKPIGANIIGASGRIDISGKLNRESVVYLQPGGPHLHTKVLVGGKTVEENSSSFFKRIDKGGWYWIESARLGRAIFLDKQLFLDILSEVSGYEFD